MSRAFATREFDRWSRKERIEDATLLDSVERADAGLLDASLLGCLIKLRIARKGEGKRGGYRTIIAYRSGDRAFFLYGFAKNDRANVRGEEAEALDDYGAQLLALSEAGIAGQIGEGKIREIRR